MANAGIEYEWPCTKCSYNNSYPKTQICAMCGEPITAEQKLALDIVVYGESGNIPNNDDNNGSNINDGNNIGDPIGLFKPVKTDPAKILTLAEKFDKAKIKQLNKTIYNLKVLNIDEKYYNKLIDKKGKKGETALECIPKTIFDSCIFLDNDFVELCGLINNDFAKIEYNGKISYGIVKKLDFEAYGYKKIGQKNKMYIENNFIGFTKNFRKNLLNIKAKKDVNAKKLEIMLQTAHDLIQIADEIYIDLYGLTLNQIKMIKLSDIFVNKFILKYFNRDINFCDRCMTIGDKIEIICGKRPIVFYCKDIQHFDIRDLDHNKPVLKNTCIIGPKTKIFVNNIKYTIPNEDGAKAQNNAEPGVSDDVNNSNENNSNENNSNENNTNAEVKINVEDTKIESESNNEVNSDESKLNEEIENIYSKQFYVDYHDPSKKEMTGQVKQELDDMKQNIKHIKKNKSTKIILVIGVSKKYGSIKYSEMDNDDVIKIQQLILRYYDAPIMFVLLFVFIYFI